MSEYITLGVVEDKLTVIRHGGIDIFSREKKLLVPLSETNLAIAFLILKVRFE